jgi:hypothetical protein
MILAPIGVETPRRFTTMSPGPCTSAAFAMVALEFAVIETPQANRIFPTPLATAFTSPTIHVQP